MLEAGRVVLDDVDVLRERKPAYEGRHGQHREGGTEKKSQRERWRRSSQAARARQTLVRSPSYSTKKNMMTGFAIFFGTWRSALVEYVANEERKEYLYLRSGRVDCVSVPVSLHS